MKTIVFTAALLITVWMPAGAQSQRTPAGAQAFLIETFGDGSHSMSAGRPSASSAVVEDILSVTSDNQCITSWKTGDPNSEMKVTDWSKVTRVFKNDYDEFVMIWGGTRGYSFIRLRNLPKERLDRVATAAEFLRTACAKASATAF